MIQHFQEPQKEYIALDFTTYVELDGFNRVQTRDVEFVYPKGTVELTEFFHPDGHVLLSVPTSKISLRTLTPPTLEEVQAVRP